MAHLRVRVLVLVLVLSVLVAIAEPAAARVLTREDVAPLLARKVVIPNRLETPHATPWPEEFAIEFTTDDGAASGVLAYDWGNKQQVILHGRGAAHCLSRGSKGSCYILENSVGTYEVDPVGRKCELTSPGVGSVPPSWVMQGVFAGVEEVNGVKCNRFNYPPTMHAWLETVEGGLPCAFLFPDPARTYVFALSSLKIGRPALSMFAVPEYCTRDASKGLREADLKADQ